MIFFLLCAGAGRDAGRGRFSVRSAAERPPAAVCGTLWDSVWEQQNGYPTPPLKGLTGGPRPGDLQRQPIAEPPPGH